MLLESSGRSYSTLLSVQSVVCNHSVLILLNMPNNDDFNSNIFPTRNFHFRCIAAIL